MLQRVYFRSQALRLSSLTINIGVYALLYLVMVKFGAVIFIQYSCWGVWALWALSNTESRDVVLDVLISVFSKERGTMNKAIVLALSAVKSNVKPNGAEFPYIDETDGTELCVALGESVVYPENMLLLDCDNGFKSNTSTIVFVDDQIFLKKKRVFDASNKIKSIDIFETLRTLNPSQLFDVTAVRGQMFTWPRGYVLVYCDDGLPPRPGQCMIPTQKATSTQEVETLRWDLLAKGCTENGLTVQIVKITKIISTSCSIPILLLRTTEIN